MKPATRVPAGLLFIVIAGLWMGSAPAFAQSSAAPSAADQKIQRLEGCIDHFKQARAGWSTDPSTQESYSDKITTAKQNIADLKAGKDISEKEIDETCESPHTAPY
jgi:hypothetical protein